MKKLKKLKKGMLVEIISGAHKSRKQRIKKVLKNNYLHLEHLVGLSSKKVAYNVNIHRSNLKVIY